MLSFFHKNVLCGLVEGKLTRVWPIRTLHILGQRDWFKGGQVSQTGPLKALPVSFTWASWEGCSLLLHVDKDFSEKKTSKTEKWREKDTVSKSCSVFFFLDFYLFIYGHSGSSLQYMVFSLWWLVLLLGARALGSRAQ